jgi:hypothetical protein
VDSNAFLNIENGGQPAQGELDMFGNPLGGGDGGEDLSQGRGGLF